MVTLNGNTLSFYFQEIPSTAFINDEEIIYIKHKKAPMTFVIEAFGGDNRDRTGDLLNAIQALSQLSYTPTGLDYNTRLI